MPRQLHDLAWWLLGLAGRRVQAAGFPVLGPVIVSLVAALSFGAAMAVTFFTGHEPVTRYLFFSLLALAVFLPIYRPESLLGFVLGVSVAFGFPTK